MSITEIRQQISNNRYRKYANAKSKIPRDLPPEEYEKAVRKLAKKYKV